MLLKSVMWNIFQDTGRVDAYLYYLNCDEENQEHESCHMNESEQAVKQYDC